MRDKAEYYRQLAEEAKEYPEEVVTYQEFLSLLLKSGVKPEKAIWRANILLRQGDSMMVDGKLLRIKEIFSDGIIS